MIKPMTDDDRETLKILGTRIRAWRKYKGLTQIETAFHAHITRAHLSKIESGKASLSVITLLKIHKAMDPIKFEHLKTTNQPIKLSQLIGEDPPKNHA